MKYKVTIDRVIETDTPDTPSKRFPDTIEIYHQYVDELNVAELVKWINTPTLKPTPCTP